MTKVAKIFFKLTIAFKPFHNYFEVSFHSGNIENIMISKHNSFKSPLFTYLFILLGSIALSSASHLVLLNCSLCLGKQLGYTMLIGLPLGGILGIVMQRLFFFRPPHISVFGILIGLASAILGIMLIIMVAGIIGEAVLFITPFLTSLLVYLGYSMGTMLFNVLQEKLHR